MEKYFNIFINGYKGYANYLWYEITHPNWHNYSLFFLILEVVIPWRKKVFKEQTGEMSHITMVTKNTV